MRGKVSVIVHTRRTHFKHAITLEGTTYVWLAIAAQGSPFCLCHKSIPPSAKASPERLSSVITLLMIAITNTVPSKTVDRAGCFLVVLCDSGRLLFVKPTLPNGAAMLLLDRENKKSVSEGVEGSSGDQMWG
jgi:hypothetical protein